MQQRIGAGKFHLSEILCRLNRRIVSEGAGKQCQICGYKGKRNKQPQKQFPHSDRTGAVYFFRKLFSGKETAHPGRKPGS